MNISEMASFGFLGLETVGTHLLKALGMIEQENQGEFRSCAHEIQ